MSRGFMQQDKDFYRKMKRFLKKEGNKRKRQWLKHQLEENPEEAPYDDYEFGDLSSKWLNGLDHDATRKNKRPPKSQQDMFLDSPYWIDEGEK
jgi:hypothetical protein